MSRITVCFGRIGLYVWLMGLLEKSRFFDVFRRSCSSARHKAGMCCCLQVVKALMDKLDRVSEDMLGRLDGIVGLMVKED